jgi:hypothetical protein
MAPVTEDPAREQRIIMGIIVDAYDEEEQALGWWTYLAEKISFPFEARCISERRVSPLRPGEQVKVVRMAPEEGYMREAFVEIEWAGRTFGVPLSQLEPIGVDENTKEAIQDWHYWAGRE